MVKSSFSVSKRSNDSVRHFSSGRALHSLGALTANIWTQENNAHLQITSYLKRQLKIVTGKGGMGSRETEGNKLELNPCHRWGLNLLNTGWTLYQLSYWKVDPPSDKASLGYAPWVYNSFKPSIVQKGQGVQLCVNLRSSYITVIKHTTFLRDSSDTWYSPKTSRCT